MSAHGDGSEGWLLTFLMDFPAFRRAAPRRVSNSRASPNFFAPRPDLLCKNTPQKYLEKPVDNIKTAAKLSP
jgi:hypothetical protein